MECQLVCRAGFWMLEYGVECLLGLRAQTLQCLPHEPIQGPCHGPVRETIEEFLAEFENEMRLLQMLNVSWGRLH